MGLETKRSAGQKHANGHGLGWNGRRALGALLVPGQERLSGFGFWISAASRGEVTSIELLFLLYIPVPLPAPCGPQEHPTRTDLGALLGAKGIARGFISLRR